MLGGVKSRGEHAISTIDPWRAIRSNRGLVFSLPLVLGLGVILGTWLFPTWDSQELLARVGVVVVVIGWLLVLWPAPCPRCRRPFLLWSIQNWPYWFRIYLKTSFAPFRYFDRVFNGPCPHCDLPFGAQLKGE
jgi:hypothetical protein